MSEPCRPCDDVRCETTDDTRAYGLEGFPPLPLPPVVPPVPESFSNDVVYYDVECEEGSSLEYEGTLPAWITIDNANIRLVGSAGTFRSETKAEANATAQAALDAFAVSALEDDTLTCGCSEPDVVGTGDFSDALYSFNLVSMAVNGNEAIAVGIGGQILSSDDGLEWEAATSGTSSVLWASAYGGGFWVAAGDSGLVLSSPDRITWTDHSIVGAVDFYGVAYGEGLFVAGDADGKIYSSPTGTTWTLRHDYTGESIYNNTYGGGLFVVVGANGFIATSPDGITWTERVSGTAEALYDVGFQNGVFVAISGISLTVLRSTDGITWADTTIPSSDTTVYAIGQGGGFFVTITQESGEVWYSVDGETWTQKEPALCPEILMVDFYSDCQFNLSIPLLPDPGCEGVYEAFDIDSGMQEGDIVANGDFLVAVGIEAPDLVGRIRTSDNGLCWTTRTNPGPSPPADSRLNSVAFGNGIYMAVGSPKLVITSSDGITWTLKPELGGLDPNTEVFALAFGLGLFVAAVNHSSDWDIYTSPDGTSWTLRQSESGIADETIQFMEFANNIFMAVGAYDLVYTSTDAITWTPRTVPTSGNVLQEVAFGNGVWVATIDDSNVLRSTDNGVTWALVAVPDQMFSITFGNGLFVLMTDNTDEIYTSTDGLTWTLNNASVVSGRVRYYKDCIYIT